MLCSSEVRFRARVRVGVRARLRVRVMFASGLLCSSESVVCFVAGAAPLVWCRSVFG